MPVLKFVNRIVMSYMAPVIFGYFQIAFAVINNVMHIFIYSFINKNSLKKYFIFQSFSILISLIMEYVGCIWKFNGFDL